jgi:hypothetical protein
MARKSKFKRLNDRSLKTVKGTWIKNKAWWAAMVYLARKCRHMHPDGSMDKAGRWYPSGDEQECCAKIRRPSRRFPWGLLTHCRSSKHVANLLRVDPKEVAKHSRAIAKAGGADTAWLAASMVDCPGSITRKRDANGVPFSQE